MNVSRWISGWGVPFALASLVAFGSVGCASGPSEARLRAIAFEQDTRARARYDIATHYLAQGRTALALREYLEAEKLRPTDPWIQLGLAECYRRNGLYDKSEMHLLAALDARPQFQTAMLNLSAVYIHLEQYDRAADFARRLAEDPTYPAPWRAFSNLGWALLGLDQLDASRDALEKAIQFDPTFWPAHLNLGILEQRAGRRVAAIDAFQRVIELEPGPSALSEASYRLGELFVALGDRDRALEHLTVASESAPGGPWGKKSEEYLELLR